MKSTDKGFILLASLMATEIRHELGRAKRLGGILPFDAAYEAICMRRNVKGSADLKREIGIKIHEQIERRRGKSKSPPPVRITKKEIDSWVADYELEESSQKRPLSKRRL